MAAPTSTTWKSGCRSTIGKAPAPAAEIRIMFELVLQCPEDKVESVSDALDALDALSVSVEDADAQSDAERPLFGEPGLPPPKEGWQRSQIIGLFASEAAAQEAARLLQVQDFFERCELLRIAA